MSVRKFSFSSAELLLQRDGSLSDQHLALLLESNPGRALPATLHDYIVRHLRKEIYAQPREEIA